MPDVCDVRQRKRTKTEVETVLMRVQDFERLFRTTQRCNLCKGQRQGHEAKASGVGRFIDSRVQMCANKDRLDSRHCSLRFKVLLSVRGVN